jgi:hypothetical protein
VTGSAQSAETLKRAASVSTAAPGYKATITMDAVTGPSAGRTNSDLTVSGSFSPGSHTVDMTMRLPGPGTKGALTGHVQFVRDGNAVYVKVPTSIAAQQPGHKPWLSMNLTQMGKISATFYSSLFLITSYYSKFPGAFMAYLRATAGTVKNLGEENMNGVQTTHYQARVGLAKAPSLLPAAGTPAPHGKAVRGWISVDAWIDASHHIRRIRFTEKTVARIPSESSVTHVTETLSDYGPQSAPTVPSADQTTNLLSLVTGG